MKQMKRGVILMVVLLMAAPGIVRAEDDPISPPVSEIPKAPAAKTPAPATPAPEAGAPAADPGWSPPTTATRRELPADNLPAPLVRDPRTGSRLSGGGRMAPRTGSDPSATSPSATSMDPLLGTGSRMSPPPPSSEAATIPSTPTFRSGAQIETVSKMHNLPLPDKKLALRLDVTFSVQGARGRAVYLEVDFQRMDTGETVRSTLPVYANPNGTLAVRTALSTVPVDAGRFAASVWVPYQAFPSPTDVDMYSVTANVKLQRSEAGRAPTTLATATTTFNVHAPAPALPDTRELLPKAPMAPEAPSTETGPLDIDAIDADPVVLDDPFAPPVAKGSPDGE
jgi:hypothetical protein